MQQDTDIKKLLKDFFREVFIEKCNLEETSMTVEEEESMNELDCYDIIGNLKDIFTDLLSFKKESIKLDKSELIQRSEQFESMLQKLEAEVRNHIRVEHQLKLHIEDTQVQTEELEIKNNNYLSQIRELNEKMKSHTRGADKKEFVEKIGKLENTISKKDALICKLENDIVRLKKFEVEAKENSKIGKKNRESKEDFEEIKQKLEVKAADLMKLENFTREKNTPKPMKERNKSLRKSNNDQEVKNKIAEIKNNFKSFTKSHSRSTSEQVRPLSGIKKYH